MTLPITTLYSLPLVPIFILLFIRVSSRRAEMKASIGDAGDVALHERIRRHGNFVEWVPFVLILMALAEAGGAGPMALHAAGAALVIGRVLHPIGLRADNHAHPLRIAGNSLNLLSVAILAVVIGLARIGL